MPVLGKRSTAAEVQQTHPGEHSAALFPACANPTCASSWLQVWRNRKAPVIEGGWVCSPACTAARIAELLHRERNGHTETAVIHRHRIPIGLVLLAEGWITHDQLRAALEAQRAGAEGRIGAWLMKHCGLEEHRVTQALSIQWNCPVFSHQREQLDGAVSMVPRLFLDTFGVFPVRLSNAGILYIAFEDRIDHSLTLALERMTGLKVEAGLMSSSEFRLAHERLLTAKFPRARLMEAAGVEAMVNALTRLVEKEKPAEVRIVRVHGYYWFRLWKHSRTSQADPHPAAMDAFEDVICSLTRFQ